MSTTITTMTILITKTKPIIRNNDIVHQIAPRVIEDLLLYNDHDDTTRIITMNCGGSPSTTTTTAIKTHLWGPPTRVSKAKTYQRTTAVGQSTSTEYAP